MSSTLLMLTVFACGFLTFAIRLSFILIGQRWSIGPGFQHVLRYIPPAVLSALIAPEVFVHAGSYDFSFRNPRLWAAGTAILAAFYTRNIFATIAAGMFTLWFGQYLL